MRTNNIINAIKTFCESEVKDLNFALIFGSTVLGKKDSDIDFKIFSKASASDELRKSTAYFAENLHKEFVPHYKLGEYCVPYEVKTIISNDTLNASLNLKVFLNDFNKLVIPEIILSKEFLNSELCQMRTVLSALTTPNIFVCGDKESYNNTTFKAFLGIRKLICGIYNLNQNNLEQIINLLLNSPNGQTYKNYLGYKDNPIIREHLLTNLRKIKDD